MADQEPENPAPEQVEEQASAETTQNDVVPDSGDTTVEKSAESKDENVESEVAAAAPTEEVSAEAENSETKQAEEQVDDAANEQAEEAGDVAAEDSTHQLETAEQDKPHEDASNAEIAAVESTHDGEPEQVTHDESQETAEAETTDAVTKRESAPQSPVTAVNEPVVEETMAMLEGELPQPGTPDKEGSDVGEEELLMVEEEEPPPEYNREELLLQYQAAVAEREQLNIQNRTLQHKLSEYYSKKKSEESRQEVDKNTADQEQRYMKYMSNLEELRLQQTLERNVYEEQLEEMKERKIERQQRVEEEWSKSIEIKKAVALGAINSRSGRPIYPKDLEVYEANERKKEGEVSHVRLENIKLKNRLKKQESQLKQKEELAEGLHLIDFEQLKIENQTYNEKIEERNEELLKLRKKITSTVQVLTHLKEKLQFVQAENFIGKDQLFEVEREVAQKRDVLSRTKQSRDALRHENNKLQQKCGLLGNTDLLRDFEVGTDEADRLEHRLDMLKRTHAELTLNLNGIKKKIELSKENQS